jgi:hypothetical protein
MRTELLTSEITIQYIEMYESVRVWIREANFSNLHLIQ